MYNEGRSVQDDPRPGQAISATSENYISTVKVIVDEDARYTVEGISDIPGLSASYLF
jgi:hypothetical protein